MDSLLTILAQIRSSALDWMYKGPSEANANERAREAVMLGAAPVAAPVVDPLQKAKEAGGALLAAPSASADRERDIKAKLREDPLVLIKRREQEHSARTGIYATPHTYSSGRSDSYEGGKSRSRGEDGERSSHSRKDKRRDDETEEERQRRKQERHEKRERREKRREEKNRSHGSSSEHRDSKGHSRHYSDDEEDEEERKRRHEKRREAKRRHLDSEHHEDSPDESERPKKRQDTSPQHSNSERRDNRNDTRYDDRDRERSEDDRHRRNREEPNEHRMYRERDDRYDRRGDGYNGHRREERDGYDRGRYDSRDSRPHRGYGDFNRGDQYDRRDNYRRGQQYDSRGDDRRGKSNEEMLEEMRRGAQQLQAARSALISDSRAEETKEREMWRHEEERKRERDGSVSNSTPSFLSDFNSRSLTDTLSRSRPTHIRDD